MQTHHKPTTVTPAPGEYGKQRRLLGSAYVGTIVVASTVLLSTGLVPRIFSSADTTSQQGFLNLLAFVAAFELISLPFDLIGFKIESTHGRTRQSRPSYLADLARGIFVHALILTAVALSIEAAVNGAGTAGLLAAALALSLLLLWKQPGLASLYGKISFVASDDISDSYKHKKVPVYTAKVEESGFTGGIVGLPGAESIVIPEAWLSTLTKPELDTEIRRRLSVIRSQGRTRGVALALAFTMAGVWLASIITARAFSLALTTSAGLITMSLCFTLWSFAGLVTLPFWSRLGVYEADRLAVQDGISEELLEETISKINKNLEDESSRTPVVETIYHPVPTVINRLIQLRSSATTTGAWQAARYAVVLSLVGLGLLGRAVHCNAGKPVLWGMPPSD
ncbi:MAG: hypothetical protein JSS83_17835 [Cyanobacteria bacterium SZAS LIN-3]|nr:hypothetical protein [Cyanobacteria bacterium SZAS LIN-3]MBS2005612.1 hypothetical protein [Cyanobacteria bacterium SZAS TMP-1]